MYRNPTTSVRIWKLALSMYLIENGLGGGYVIRCNITVVLISP